MAMLELLKVESSDFDLRDAVVARLEGVEIVGRLFQHEVEIVTSAEGIDADSAVGAELDLVFFDPTGLEQRRVRGMVTSIVEPLVTEGVSRRYRLRIAPPAHRMTMVRTTDIYLDLSFLDIIKKKADLVGLADGLQVFVGAALEARDFVVQFEETDLAFVSRLAEHVGIGIVYEDEGNLRLADHNAGYGQLDAPIPFRPSGQRTGIHELEITRSAIPESYVARDYNYRTPLVDLSATHVLEGAQAGGINEYGSHFKTPEEGALIARVRAEERGVERQVLRGVCADSRLRAGARVTMEGHPTLGDYEMFVYEVRHTLTQGVAAAGESAEARHDLTFLAIPNKVPFRPARHTPKPTIPGVVTGIVESPLVRPEIAHLDEQGRYRIRFLFDSTPPGERQASHALRMIQAHVGADYGIHFPLKPGVEVLMAFVNGDPDRPIIVGAVPNPLTRSPVDVSTNTLNRIKTESGILMEFGDERINS